MKLKPIVSIFLPSLLLFVAVQLSAQDQLKSIHNWHYFSDAPYSMYQHLSGQAYEQLSMREKAVAEFSTAADWQKRQRQIRETLMDIVGPFPEKTPLDATVTRVVQKDGFRAEHIIFESRPGFKVTSTLFIPNGIKRKSKAPAVIYCSGHGATGYRSEGYQHLILNLVKKGFIVFAFDPVGQGERLGYLDEKTGNSMLGGPTKEHSYPGSQVFITGSSQANYMIWDGIRAVDYLLTRSEVDPARIGITGRSGGGTQSSHIAAFDDRIYAVAPENYLTNYRRLLQSRGPQDAEQNFYHGIARGLDHPDLLIVRAPKPALMVLTYNDIFNIQGARDTYQEAKRVYQAFGKPENISVTEDFAGHASTQKNREALYAFFQEHLSNPGNPRDEDVVKLTPDEIRVTSTGQLSTSVGSETVFSLNKAQTEAWHKDLQLLRNDLAGWKPELLATAKKLTGYMKPNENVRPVLTGADRKSGFTIEKYFIMGEGNYPVPYLLYIPEKHNSKAMICLYPEGKGIDSLNNYQVTRFVKEGYIVLVPDLLGTGETFPVGFQGDAFFQGVSYNLWYASILIGRSIVGIRAGDFERLVNLLGTDTRVTETYALAKGNMAPVLLHAAAFIPTVKAVVLVEPVSSYRLVATTRMYSPQYILNATPAMLKYYDLPDLAATLAPRKLVIMQPVNAMGENSPDEVKEDLEIIRAGYNRQGASGSLFIESTYSFDSLAKYLR